MTFDAFASVIPEELLALRQWVSWKAPKKEPIDPRSGSLASTSEPKTWTSFAEAAATGRQGFVFTVNDAFVGIDLDGCIDQETGEPLFWAVELMSLFQTYAERSISGTGIHLITRGIWGNEWNSKRLPEEYRAKGSTKDPKIEVYDWGRYFVVTGEPIAGYERITANPDELERLHAKFAPKPAPAPRIRAATEYAIDDDDVLRLMFLHAKGNARELYHGDIRPYLDDDSAADLALCNHLAWWTGGNVEQIDRLFRASGLHQSAERIEKWSSPRPGGTYGSNTIQKAISGQTSFYNPGGAQRGGFVPQEERPPHPADAIREFSGANGKPAEFVPERANSVVSVVALITPTPPTDLEPECLYGLPGDVVRVLDPHTEASPAAILTSFLLGAGCLFGPNPYVYRDGAYLTARDFAVIVGQSSQSRKGTTTRRTDEIFNCINDSKYTKCDYMNMRGQEDSLWKALQLSGLGSGEALIESLAQDDVDLRRMIFEEEFSRPLKVMRREGSTLSDILRAAWDGSPLSNITKGRKLQSKGGHVSILGHITPIELAAELRSASMFNGFANRFLWIYVSGSKSLPFGGGKAPIAPLVLRLHEALQIAREGNVEAVEFDDEVRLLWDNKPGCGFIYDVLKKRPQGLLGEVTARAPAHVTKLSLLWALLDGARQIEMPHMLAALAFWDLAEKSVAYLFGSSTGNDAADRIIESLREVYPEALNRQQIRDLFQRNAAPGAIPAALKLIHEFGMATAEMADPEGRGRPAELWRALPYKGYDGNDVNALRKAREWNRQRANEATVGVP